MLEASFEQAREEGSFLLIESTCNQVNQYGGYSGLTPAGFMAFAREIAGASGFPVGRLIVGGDHLGPFPFRAESARSAMEKAREMVRGCVHAGYQKLHLDTSMRLADDPGDPRTPLDRSRIADRCADLCEVAEAAWAERGGSTSGAAGDAGPPVYVIGTDVPAPGGSGEVETGIHITTAAEMEQTIAVTRERFLARGLGSAWERVIAVVVQPGVEFGDHTIVEYDRSKARHLSDAARGAEGLVMEGHSTDYQTPRALREMVEDGIAILKVGPALSAAAREAVFLLSLVEEELCRLAPRRNVSGIVAALERAMKEDPAHWKGHYIGDATQVAFSLRFSLLDRARYYWGTPGVERALGELVRNLSAGPIPLSLLSQYLPGQYDRIRAGLLDNEPRAIIRDRVRKVIQGYSRAVGNLGENP